MTTITATASNPRRSTHVEIPSAIDVDVTIAIGYEVGDPTTLSGEVTLAPRQYDGRLAAYGDSPDHWISGALLRELRALKRDDFRSACQALEAAARNAGAV